ncbi:MAG: phosphoglycerate kinase [Helicobacter sp.]|nr:phosphoglycerate kinase [Helicobacter sp.]
MKTLKDLDLNNKSVLMRVDFNVPIHKDGKNKGQIADDLRIRSALKSINYVLENGAKSLVLVSHFGRPKGADLSYSLKNIKNNIEELLNKPIIFASSIKDAREILESQNKPIILLENIRFNEGETKNDKELSKNLASLCDVYINDAFGASHRAHASISGICEFVNEKAAGFLLENEIKSFQKVLSNPERPLLLIIGGSKVSTKLELLKNVLNFVDEIIIGGAMSNTFLKAKGFDMKSSLVELELLDEAKAIMQDAKNRDIELHLPVDLVVSSDFKTPTNVANLSVSSLRDGDIALDIGSSSINNFKDVINRAKSIIWNGPVGMFEVRAFANGSFEIARALANSRAFSLVGGGDSASAIKAASAAFSENLEKQIDFISTGGGAGLEMLEGKILPAISALES